MQLTPEATFTDAASVRLWIFIVLAMFGVITGNIRIDRAADPGHGA